MGGFLRAFREGLTDGAGKPMPEIRPVSCTACGLTFSSQSAYACHLEPMGGGRDRCMPESRLEGSLMTKRDGVWHLAGSDSAIW